jgi:hypothetical protein
MSTKLLTIALMVLLAMGALAQNATPPVPTNLKAEIAPTMGPMPVVKLSWDALEGPWGYRLYRSSDDSLHFAPLAMTNVRFFYDHTVAGGATFYYQVRSVTVAPDTHIVESPPSNTAWITLTPPPPVLKGIITGTVKDDSTNDPIKGIFIQFYRMDPASESFALPFAMTDSLGRYKAELPVGSYTIRAEPPPYMPPGPPPYISEWYDNVFEQSKATTVKVEDGKTFTADFGLSRMMYPVRPKGVVSGTVIDDTTKKPIPRAMVRFFSQNPTIMIFPPPTAVADSLGQYEATLDTATYLIRAEGPPICEWRPIYKPEWYDNVTDIGKATPVHVTPGSKFIADFGLSKFYLPRPVAIEGMVTDTLGNPLHNALVMIIRPIQMMNTMDLELVDHDEAMTIEGVGYCRGVVWKGTTDSAGHYRATVLSGQEYVAMAVMRAYLTEYYKEKSNPLQADIIKVDDNIQGINFSLTPNPVLKNSVSGVVRDSLGNGIPSRIILFPIRPVWPTMPGVRFGHTDSLGVYTLGDVRAGKYFVLAVPFRGYAPAFYREGTYGVMHWQKADTVVIIGDITGINIGVVPPKKRGLTIVAGRVSGQDGGPLNGVRVFALSAEGEMLGFGLSDVSGGYVVDGLDASSMTLAFDCEGYQPAQVGVTPAAGQYAVNAVDVKLAAVATSIGVVPFMPQAYKLHQNYPNPFNPSTTITFDMPDAGAARLVIYNLLGQEVVTLYNKPVSAGRFVVSWNGKDNLGRFMATGIYLVQFTASDAAGGKRFSQMKKMLLVK